MVSQLLNNPASTSVAQLVETLGLQVDPHQRYYVCNKVDYNDSRHWIDLCLDDQVDQDELWFIVKQPNGELSITYIPTI